MSKLFPLLPLLLILYTYNTIYAQEDLTQNSLFLKIGVPNNFFDNGDKLSIPLLSIKYERQLNSNFLAGISAAFTSSKSDTYRFSNDQYYYRKSYFCFSVNTSYKLKMIPIDIIDFYTGLDIGYKFGNPKFIGEGDLNEFDLEPYPASDGFIYAVFLQARYQLKNNLYAFAEIGIGYSPLNIGLIHTF